MSPSSSLIAKEVAQTALRRAATRATREAGEGSRGEGQPSTSGREDAARAPAGGRTAAGGRKKDPQAQNDSRGGERRAGSRGAAIAEGPESAPKPSDVPPDDTEVRGSQPDEGGGFGRAGESAARREPSDIPSTLDGAPNGRTEITTAGGASAGAEEKRVAPAGVDAERQRGRTASEGPQGDAASAPATSASPEASMDAMSVEGEPNAADEVPLGGKAPPPSAPLAAVARRAPPPPLEVPSLSAPDKASPSLPSSSDGLQAASTSAQTPSRGSPARAGSGVAGAESGAVPGPARAGSPGKAGAVATVGVAVGVGGGCVSGDLASFERPGSACKRVKVESGPVS